MPRKAKSKPIYKRGGYWLAWDRKADGSLRSPNFAIFWYDRRRGRIRSVSARTSEAAEAIETLDRLYLSRSKTSEICPTCGQKRGGRTNPLILRAIEDYLITKEEAPSIEAIRARLVHVVDYIATLPSPNITCAEIDEIWIKAFRGWLSAQPIISTAGKNLDRTRALSTIENSVIQFAAAINASKGPLLFKPIQTKELNNTPTRRLSVGELAEAFRYATDARLPTKRGGLHRFLMLSVATAGRPDAIHEFSTAESKRQWNAERQIICLNPKGRRQTKKYRAAVAAPAQIVPILKIIEGPLILQVSIRSAWNSMVKELAWPREGEGGMKLIRRSIAQLLRDAGTKKGWNPDWQEKSRKVPSDEIELQLGHRKLDSVSDLYAMFDPDYLSNATDALEGIIGAIIEIVPEAFELPEKTSTVGNKASPETN